MQIIVLGMHRSGTSTVTRMVNMMGAFVGHNEDLIGANEENPSGFWEREDVIAANDALLQHYGCEWYALEGWQYNGDKEAELPTDVLKAQFQSVVDTLNKQSSWVIKDPRMCHTLPFWLPYLNNPALVITHRDPLEIALSLKKRNQFLTQHSLALWEYAVVGILNASRKYHGVHVNYRDIIENPVKVAQALFEMLDKHTANILHLPDRAVIESFVETSLYRSRLDDLSEDKIMTPHQISLRNTFDQGKKTGSILKVSAGAEELAGLGGKVGHLQEGLNQREEELRRALDTVKRQEARMDELASEVAKSNDAFERMQKAYDEQKTVNEELCNNICRLEMVETELHAIKQTKLWKLRSLILRESTSDNAD